MTANNEEQQHLGKTEKSFAALTSQQQEPNLPQSGALPQVNAVNMAKWIVALRSGKYAQGRGALRKGDAFCCLAVYCDISGLGKWETDMGSEHSAYAIPGAGRSIASLPPLVSQTLFPLLPIGNPQLAGRDDCIAANDVAEWSFNQIADALESRYLPNTTAESVLSQTEEGK